MDELPWPVLGSEVLAAKAIPERAMRQLYEPVYPGVYAPAGVDTIAFLASDYSSYLTGEVISVSCQHP